MQQSASTSFASGTTKIQNILETETKIRNGDKQTLVIVVEITQTRKHKQARKQVNKQMQGLTRGHA